MSKHIDELEAGKAPLFVGHAGEGAVSSSQEILFRELENHYQGQTLERLRVWMAFPNNLFKDVPAEMTTRGRSFLFFAAGIFASTGLDKTVALRVPENGLIALNVPLDQLRLGALSTRTTHPFYIERLNELPGILGISTRIENPYPLNIAAESDRLREFTFRAFPAAMVSLSSQTEVAARVRWVG